MHVRQQCTPLVGGCCLHTEKQIPLPVKGHHAYAYFYDSVFSHVAQLMCTRLLSAVSQCCGYEDLESAKICRHGLSNELQHAAGTGRIKQCGEMTFITGLHRV